MSNLAQSKPPPFEFVCSDDEDEWKDSRRTGIGASEIAIIMGASEWSSNLEIYYDKIGEHDREEDREEDEWLFWGRKLEGAIRAELCERAGVSLSHRNMLLRSTEHRWALATPDGLTAESEPVETKNIAWGYDPNEWSDSIPEKYYLQCQQQMLVTGAQRCLFGALLWGSRLIWEWIPRDEVAIRRIIKAGSGFWSHVERREAPLPDGHPGGRKLLRNFAVVENGVELFEPEIAEHLGSYQDNNAQLKDVRARERMLKKRRDAAADAIAQKMGRHRKAHTATGWQFCWETTRRNGYTVEPKEYDQLKIDVPKVR